MRATQNVDVLSNRRFGGLRWALPVVFAVAVVDQLTKQWALDRLIAGSCDTPDACIDLVAGARLHLVFNTGAAFARGQGFGEVLGVLVGVITVALLIAAARRVDRLGPILLGLVAGGAIGNLIDRVTRAEDGFLSGAVVDFVDLGWWPVFNVADAAVVCGVVGFVALVWLRPEHDPPDVIGVEPRHQPSAAEPGG
ncbi:MAG: signal peptidase II [Acidimicrobiia bacterium]|nr:signal peptidase II [Acidimicrobiia bacterium]